MGASDELLRQVVSAALGLIGPRVGAGVRRVVVHGNEERVRVYGDLGGSVGGDGVDLGLPVSAVDFHAAVVASVGMPVGGADLLEAEVDVGLVRVESVPTKAGWDDRIIISVSHRR